MVAVVTPDKSIVSLAAQASGLDFTWIVDSGCTRHITQHAEWIKAKQPMGGTITVGGKNKSPISAVGRVELKIVDSKGANKILKLNDVLYAPQLTFSLRSVPAAVKQDFCFTFKRGVCIKHQSTLQEKANIAGHADLYQFDVNPT
ncbi:TPA: hypothetical protein N0F65_002665 [Lagenidium giganteum]|uniref:Retrovirus-related Pol polyprotein from transposon TNT 1-94-like beta-barrel domain-containing protein n=1 Tax=Lagenidium giganteum TaxID=4803 RepID=A0AAV2Z8U0_9STRA|nr:TPA: hypothetical protein N0F65_002665 [Lagenidium giganteum]